MRYTIICQFEIVTSMHMKSINLNAIRNKITINNFLFIFIRFSILFFLFFILYLKPHYIDLFFQIKKHFSTSRGESFKENENENRHGTIS